MSEKALEEDDVLLLKHKQTDLQRRIERTKITALGTLFSTVVGALLGIAYALLLTNIYNSTTNTVLFARLFAFGILGGFGGGGLYVYVLLLVSSSLKPKLREIEYQLIKKGADELQERIEEDFFNKLIKINFKYIDQYYLQTQEQANKSFNLCRLSAVAGLIIIAIGIAMMFLQITKPAYVTAAAGVLSEFIAAIFFYLYNKTVLKMSDYHQKLVITQNISLALKISEDLPTDEKHKTKVFLIERLTDNVNKLLVSPK